MVAESTRATPTRRNKGSTTFLRGRAGRTFFNDTVCIGSCVFRPSCAANQLRQWQTLPLLFLAGRGVSWYRCWEMPSYFVHPTADVQTNTIGDETKIWQFVVVLPGARIGAQCNVCALCLVEGDVQIGDRVTVKSGVQLWDGLTVADDVFIGPNVTFTNDRFPRSKQYQDAPLKTSIGKGASIGGGAVILPGISIGSGAMVGAGAVVTRSVPPNAVVVGNPARIVGYVGAANDRGSVPAGSPQTTGVTPTRVRGVTIHRFPLISDIRGSITVGEFERSVPFAVRRYFMVMDVPSVETRGEHAHKRCHQFLICVKGQCSVVADDGTNREEFQISSPDLGVYLPPMVWGIQYKYSSDAILLVFASDYYDHDDYIRNYGDFLALTEVGHGPLP